MAEGDGASTLLSDENVNSIVMALSSKTVEDLTNTLLSIDCLIPHLKHRIINMDDRSGRDMMAVISVEQDSTREQVVTVVGDKQVELTDMITKDGKIKKRKPKKQLTPDEVKEKLRKLRESRDDIPMKTCDVCGYRTREPYKMRRHERTHTGEKPFKCPLCPFRGAEKSVVVKHLKSNIHSKKSHIASMKSGLPGGMGLRIDCDQCSFTASSSQQMLKHKQSRHEGVVRRVGKLSCPYCDYRNSYQKVMSLHIKAHEEDGSTTMQSRTAPGATNPNAVGRSANQVITDADDDVVTVFLDDFMNKSGASADDDGVEQLLTSISA